MCQADSQPMRRLMLKLVASVWMVSSVALAQEARLNWQDQVRKCAEEQNWSAAMLIVERQIQLAPQDMDIRAWRARVLLWSGRLADAKQEYLEILAVAPNDPDTWMGLASAYSREGRIEDAKQALDRALAVDPKRADIRVAHGRALLATHDVSQAKVDFQKALDLEPANEEARRALDSFESVRKHELRVGADTDLFSFTGPNHDEGVSLTSQWTPHWRTTTSGAFYQWAGQDAQKFTASVSAALPTWGVLEVGGATANDQGVIPKNEAFLNYDRGWKLSHAGCVHGLEVVYGQHWYWYTTARILTINEMAIFYLPHDWTWSFGLIEARSHFSGPGSEWSPSEITRIGFPITGNEERGLQGNLFFAAGTENFAQVNEIGHFSSHTYGGGLRFRLTTRQSVTGVAGYQQRTQDRNETSFGITYGIRF